jgi:hypothetical protein
MKMNYKGSARGWYIRTRFVYTTDFGRISELGSDINELSEMLCLRKTKKTSKKSPKNNKGGKLYVSIKTKSAY